MADNRLGTILLEGGIVDEAALERCLAIQALTGGTRPIGRILVEQGLLDEQALERVLELQDNRHDDEPVRVVSEDLAAASLLTAAAANGASEIVVSEGRTVRVRVGGRWQPLTDVALSGPEVWDFARETMGTEVLEALAEQHFVVRRWATDGVGAGAAMAFRQFDGIAVRLVFASTTTPAPEVVGVPREVLDAIDSGRGLVLCVGERGLGRGELMATLLQRVAGDESSFVVVCDDEPMQLTDAAAMVVQRRYGVDPEVRAAALRSVVQQDPDVLFVADVGSPDTFELALRAAEGGRLVVAYLDAENVVAALSRVLDFYPEYELPRVRSSLAAVLRVVLVRQLLESVEPGASVAATELLVVGDAAREALCAGSLEDLDLLLRSSEGGSGHSLDQSMLQLLQRRRVALPDVFARSREKAWLIDRTRGFVQEEN